MHKISKNFDLGMILQILQVMQHMQQTCTCTCRGNVERSPDPGELVANIHTRIHYYIKIHCLQVAI